MDEQAPVSSPAESPLPYKDRSTGLIVFGILTIGLGILTGLVVLLMLLGQVMAATLPHSHQLNSRVLVPGILIYVCLSVVLVWLGIGSITARRWARALLLIFSWSWLAMGVTIMIMMACVMPFVMTHSLANGTSGQQAISVATLAVMMFFMLLIMGILFIILPIIWVIFYSSRHVKATCEARDPVAGWTDACPLPVLALSLWLCFSLITMLTMPFSVRGVIPFFGMFLSGIPGTMVWLTLGAIWGYSAWLLYKLDVRGWWLIIIALCLQMASYFLTYAQHDIVEMYRLMGYPEEQIEQINKMGFITGGHMSLLTSLFTVPFLGYLLFIKRYFRKES